MQFGAADSIQVRGARQHNLRNLNVDIPRDRLIVLTGLSGSGKSSLAHDTIFAEGQRRYVESLSAFARQFIEELERPDVELIEGLPPTITVAQDTTGVNLRNTVATAVRPTIPRRNALTVRPRHWPWVRAVRRVRASGP